MISSLAELQDDDPDAVVVDNEGNIIEFKRDDDPSDIPCLVWNMIPTQDRMNAWRFFPIFVESSTYSGALEPEHIRALRTRPPSSCET